MKYEQTYMNTAASIINKMSNTESVVEIPIITGDAPSPTRVFMGKKVLKMGLMICFTETYNKL